jgi:hypothetical protein
MYSSTYRFGLPVLIAAAAYAAQIRRKSFGEALSILVSIAAILFSGEFLPFSAIVMVPIVARDIAPTLRAISLPTRWKTYVSIFAFASLAMLLCIEYRDADTRVSAANDGVTVARQLAEVPGPHRIWCLDRDGELCDAFLPYAPRIRVFADERVAAYPFAVRAEAFALREPGGFRWLERLKSDRIDSVVVPADNILMRVADGRGWRKVGSAGDFAALVRT